ncbi:MAG: PD40 domain-containing protein [Acidobacteria bacterium]|nr:PD40 domain-containing protein [Acidobacteriota bacterium]
MHPDGSGQQEIVRVVVSTPQEWGDPGLGAGVEVLGATGDLAVYEAQHFHEIMRVAISRASAFPIVRTAQDGNDAYFTQLLQIPGGQSASNVVYSESTGMVAWVANVSGQAIQIRTASLAGIAGQSSSTYGAQLVSLGPGASIQGMSFSPDGARLVAGICSPDCSNGRGPDLYVLDSRSGQMLLQLTNTGANGAVNSSPKWSPSGDWITFSVNSAGQQSLWLVSAASGRSTMRRIDTGDMPSYGPSWSKDGSAIAFVGVTGGNHDIWLARNVASLIGQSAEVVKPNPQTEASGSESKPSFNCANARTPTEKLICRDASLASLERNMVTAYNQAVRQMPSDQSAAFRLQHLEWFKSYARSCNTMLDDEQRKGCIAGYLSNHTREIEAKVRR